MQPGIQPADLSFFSTLASAGSLSAAARELGITTPAVSKHLAQMQSRAGLTLVIRTTRRMSLTPKGELGLENARRILSEIDDLGQLLGVSKATPQGPLRVNATLGFGRSHIAPLISQFVLAHPQVEVQLQLSVNRSGPGLVHTSARLSERGGRSETLNEDARVSSKGAVALNASQTLA